MKKRTWGEKRKLVRKLKGLCETPSKYDDVNILIHDLKNGKNPELDRYFRALDGIELNGEAWLPIPGLASSNDKIKEFYEYYLRNHYDIGVVSFSDGHSIREIGSSYTEFDESEINFSNSGALVGSLRRAIRNHKEYYADKQTISRWGVMNHGIKLVFLRLWSMTPWGRRVN